jgi:predicted transcriptional regulator
MQNSINALTSQAEAIADTIKSAMNKSITNVTFCSVKGYVNDKGELADYLINIGVNYQTAKQKDIKFLSELDVTTMQWNCPMVDILVAKTELLESLISPSKARSEGQKEAYIHINEALKVHVDSFELYVFGSKVKKNVIEAVDYGEDKRSAKTKAKDEIRQMMKSTKYRQFKFKLNGMRMRTNGEELVFEK